MLNKEREKEYNNNTPLKNFPKNFYPISIFPIYPYFQGPDPLADPIQFLALGIPPNVLKSALCLI